MAFSSSQVTFEPRAFSIGPWKVEMHTYSVASADTSGTITANDLSEVKLALIDGPAGVGTAAPTYSGNAVTLAFADPGATRYGTILLIGR